MERRKAHNPSALAVPSGKRRAPEPLSHRSVEAAGLEDSMRFRGFLFVLALAIASTSAAPAFAKAKKSAAAPRLTAEAINGAQFSDKSGKAKLSPVVLKAQVLLDRAGFSPGVIDAHGGENFEKALRAYQQANQLGASGKLDQATWDKLKAASDEDAVATYAITDADVKGPFVKTIPKDYEKMAELDRLAYRSPRELLAEKFHMDEDLLAALNRGKKLDASGTEIVVANVPQLEATKLSTRKRKADANTGARGADRANAGDVRVEVNKTERSVRVFGSDGALIAYYPGSIGSTEKPAPSGTLEVRAVALNPTYRYDPKYAFKGQKATEPVEISPGPNGPVGLVWIALSEQSYGIHGTPEPSKVSKTESHGCVRLTNWDALALAKLVKKGTKVEFVE
jgi:lipoprotein-anchoring transpeptidase ErfK/SrfK